MSYCEKHPEDAGEYLFMPEFKEYERRRTQYVGESYESYKQRVEEHPEDAGEYLFM
jgi:hypothetical protein